MVAYNISKLARRFFISSPSPIWLRNLIWFVSIWLHVETIYSRLDSCHQEVPIFTKPSNSFQDSAILHALKSWTLHYSKDIKLLRWLLASKWTSVSPCSATDVKRCTSAFHKLKKIVLWRFRVCQLRSVSHKTAVSVFWQQQFVNTQLLLYHKFIFGHDVWILLNWNARNVKPRLDPRTGRRQLFGVSWST
jgi:hypothetical protein